MNSITPDTRLDIAQLIYQTHMSKVHHLWLHSSDSQACITLIAEGISEDNILLVTRQGKLVGVALVETQDFPHALNFTFRFFTRHFGVFSSFRKWLAFICYKRVEIKLTPETFHIEALVVSPEFRGQGIGSQMVRDASQLAGELGKTQLVVELPERYQKMLAFYHQLGFITKSKEKVKWPILRRFARRADASSYYVLEKDLLKDDPVCRSAGSSS